LGPSTGSKIDSPATQRGGEKPGREEEVVKKVKGEMNGERSILPSGRRTETSKGPADMPLEKRRN